MKRQTRHKKPTERARELRQTQTPHEILLWRILRNRSFNGWKWRRQHPIDRYFADFACIERKMVVELDGEIHGTRRDQDTARDEVLVQKGWDILRFSNSQLENEAETVLETIWAVGWIEPAVQLEKP